ncbi:MAG: spore cortex biosynthesis protein YabQ [Oscillospiraceae bacterium]|nr:spore cortex biosynthesis protein YabQ [Oscillospiraceae bacterium]
MGVDNLLQLQQATVSLAAGAAAGLVYDFLAVLRKNTGTVGALMMDSLFALLVAAGLFLIGYGPGKGELRLFMLAFLLAGMALYFALMGGRARRIMAKIYAFVLRVVDKLLWPAKKVYIFLKKVKKIAKKAFQKLKKWYTLYGRTIVPDRGPKNEKGERYETEKSRLDYEDSYIGNSGIYGAVSCRYAWPGGLGPHGAGSHGGSGEEPLCRQRSRRVRDRAQHRD